MWTNPRRDAWNGQHRNEHPRCALPAISFLTLEHGVFELYGCSGDQTKVFPDMYSENIV